MSNDSGLTNFLRDISIPQAKPVPTKTPVRPLIGKGQKKLLLIGGGVLGVLVLLAGLIVKLKTPDGTLIVKVNEPDAEVQVLNSAGEVEIT